ncbi:family S53 protease [Punctularia strigosozonata HHB-11173 SS5]|uniref:family S53 protease n=1 Tax=Punctularia strigosozonata (strain HHB-11173) TaxID=741275 RepID=UPI000441823B|nr:family S53 protease [Punctularia strigosozonata HHB-11173 SS5]EIN06133.1 family S53 protease [Punctularia strigosozonata HHB-11173 SS5]
MVATRLFFASLLAIVSAKPFENFVVHEQRDAVPSGFKVKAPASRETMLNLRLALTESNSAGLIKALYDVSTPSSKNYGQHLAKEDVEEFVAPKQESVEAVTAWLKENNISAKTLSPAGDWLGFSVSVEDASKLFDADFSVYTHEGSGKDIVRTLSYSIPASLKEHIDFVHPMTTFSAVNGIKPKVSASAPKIASNITEDISSACANRVTPTCLRSLYGIPKKAASESSNKLAVSGFIEQYANKADLKTFLGKYRTDMSSSTTFTLKKLDGGSNPQSGSEAGVEANLDIQYTVGVATGVPTIFISVGDDYQDGDLEGFLDIVNYLLDEDTPPQVLTTSYGENESDMSRSLANKLCNAYAQLGARGTSILFASGDGGVSGSQSSSCSKFVPTFPSGCPYLTSVGATTGISPETAADFSSGGFSNYFDIPDYQSDVHAAYLKKLGSTNSGKYNATGRGFPDVAAQGVSVEVVVDGSTEPVDGTSCASPIFASVISLLNDQLIAAGKSPLGFLNPWLYENSDALNDITSGDNPGCNTNGFPAKAGWDPVTGLGTPDFDKLKTAAGL